MSDAITGRMGASPFGKQPLFDTHAFKNQVCSDGHTATLAAGGKRTS